METKAAEGDALYSMGIHTFEIIAKDAKAKYKIGKSALYNVEKIDEYLEPVGSKTGAPLLCKIAKWKMGMRECCKILNVLKYEIVE